MTTDNLDITLLTTNQSGKETTINNALLALEYAFNRQLIVDMSAGNVSLTETQFTRYGVFIIDPSMTADQDLVIPLTINSPNPAQRVFYVLNYDTNWNVTVKGATGATVVLTPLTGAIITSDGVDVTAVFTNSLEQEGTRPFDLGFFFRSAPAGDLQVDYAFVRDAEFPLDLAGSVAKARAAADDVTVVDLQKNGVSFGDITWSGGQFDGTFSATASSWENGDILSIIWPTSPDALLADIAITLKGLR